MYGQGYRNKADRKRNSRLVVSDKNKPGYGQKKRADTPKIKTKDKLWHKQVVSHKALGV
jgi:hypothetical protein